MIIPDVNLLIYAYNTGDPRHRAAKKWLEELFNTSTQFGLSWLSISGFLRIITTKTLFGNGYSTSEAFEIVDEWLARPNMVFLMPTAKHYQILKKQVLAAGVSGADLTDAHFAALAIENGVTLATTDSDFSKFKDLKVVYPLTEN